MQTTIEHLAWDSNFFGYNIGRFFVTRGKAIDLNKLQEEGKSNGYKLIYIFSKEELDINLQPIDIKVLYKKEISKADFNHPLLPQTTEASEALYSLALRSGKYSRYRLDSRFGQEAFENMYKLWVDNSLAGTIADKVFNYEIDGAPAGFITISNGDTANLGLLAVSEEYGRRGIGSALIGSALREAAEYGAKQLTVPTQKKNIEACAFYEKNGFKVIDTTYIYHLWI